MTNSLSGGHSEKEKEHKERIRKLKAKTSKMRLAAERRDITLGGKKYTMKEFEDHMASTDRPTYSGEIPGAADKLRKQRANPPDPKQQKSVKKFHKQQTLRNKKVKTEFDSLNKRDGI
jgi:hypothetical protein